MSRITSAISGRGEWDTLKATRGPPWMDQGAAQMHAESPELCCG